MIQFNHCANYILSENLTCFYLHEIEYIEKLGH